MAWLAERERADLAADVLLSETAVPSPSEVAAKTQADALALEAKEMHIDLGYEL